MLTYIYTLKTGVLCCVKKIQKEQNIFLVAKLLYSRYISTDDNTIQIIFRIFENELKMLDTIVYYLLMGPAMIIRSAEFESPIVYTVSSMFPHPISIFTTS